MIKVEGTRTVEAARAGRVRANVPAGMAFALEQAGETRAAISVSGARALSSVDALIALQEMADPLSGRAKAARRGRDVLDLLDDVRDGLLDGQVSRRTLQQLVSLVGAPREEFNDAGLSAVLDEIDLRARVELAKLDFAVAK